MNKQHHYLLIVLLILSLNACVQGSPISSTTPPTDPIASISAKQLRAKGLAYARLGDFLRAQQYLSAAQSKGYDATIIVPELVKACISASSLSAALAYAKPYSQDNPDDSGMSYIVGTIYYALGNTMEAQDALQNALQSPVITIDAAFLLALIANENGQYKKAQKHLKHYLAKQSDGLYVRRANHLLTKMHSRRKLSRR